MADRALRWGNAGGLRIEVHRTVSSVARPLAALRQAALGSAVPVGAATQPRSLPGVRTTAFAVLLAALLAAAAVLLQASQRDAARQLEERFQLRMSLGSEFVRSYLDDIALRARSAAEAELSQPQPAPGALAQVAPALAFRVAVLLDSDGNLLQVVPHREDIIGTNLARSYEHLRAAVAGRTAVSGVVASASEGVPILAIATPFETPHGRRVISGGFPAAQTPLAAYLRASVPFETASAYLVDASGTVVASNGADDRSRPAELPTELLAAMSTGRSGTLSRPGGDHYFTVEHVPDTPLRLVASVSSESLYAPIQGLARWLPWIVMGSLVLVTSYLMFVMRDLGRSRWRLHAASVELERSNRELQDFASIASHDLQEPLRKIQAFGDRLATRAGGQLDAESADYLSRMQDAAGRMQQLIHELLAYSRVASRPEPPTEVDLNAVVSEVLEDLEIRVRTSGGEVHAGPLPRINASPLQMRQLFQNLVGNALKYRREEVAPVVRINALPLTKGDTELRITVSDNGIGFEQEYAERIFAPFQRLHGRTAFEGTGMGLAICRRIVERHGGTLTASGMPGQGSVFTITLPASVVTAAEPPTVRSPGGLRRKRKSDRESRD